MRTLAEKHGETLSIDDFAKLAKAMGMQYITSATMYDDDGLECKTSIDKTKNKKWKELVKKWKEE